MSSEGACGNNLDAWPPAAEISLLVQLAALRLERDAG